MRRAEHTQAKAVDGVLVRFNEGVEGGQIAGSASLQERAFVEVGERALAGQAAPPDSGRVDKFNRIGVDFAASRKLKWNGAPLQAERYGNNTASGKFGVWGRAIIVAMQC
jgi:hypothetical protein